jgi:hypothetical protein
MLFAEQIIDAVQNGKKNFVNTFVTNEDMKKTMTQFVDAQTEYTKTAVGKLSGLTTTLGLQVFSETNKVMKEMAKMPWAKKPESK